jgi:hypothetical protein
VSGNNKAVSRSIISANASSSSSTVSAPTRSTEIINDLPAPTLLSQKDTENASLLGRADTIGIQEDLLDNIECEE